MDKNAIKKFAVWARRELISRVSQKALQYGIAEGSELTFDIEIVNGRVLSTTEIKQRKALVKRILDLGKDGYRQAMEEAAYTWFNRFIAIRYMEVNGYLPTHVRVFSDENGEFKPQILTEAMTVELEGIDRDRIYRLKNSNEDEELYKYLVIKQCDNLVSLLPMMFTRIDDYTQLLFPDNILREGSVISEMVTSIPEDDWKDAVQIIGWLYQYYNAEPKDEVFKAIKEKNIKVDRDRIPAATQLFTPDWIVRFMVDNSLGRLWMEGHPNDALKKTLEYYVEEASQEDEVENRLKKMRDEYSTLRPEDIKVIDPCMGSGHILVYMFDVLEQIYQSCGYSSRDAARLILEKNLYGLDIDDRCSQLAYFAVMMKARQYDRRILSYGIRPNILSIQESHGLTDEDFDRFGKAAFTARHIYESFLNAKIYGSAINIDCTPERLEDLEQVLDEMISMSGYGSLFVQSECDRLTNVMKQLLLQAKVMMQEYHVVVTNPPYVNNNHMCPELSTFVKSNYEDFKTDLFAVFMKKCSTMTTENGFCGMFTPYVWMFISSYEKLRYFLCRQRTIETLIQFEYSAFEEATVPVCTLVFRNKNIRAKKGCYFRLTNFRGGMTVQKTKTIEAIKNHNCGYYFECSTEAFQQIPGSPIAYWVSDQFLLTFNSKKLKEMAITTNGFTTGDNNRFLRLWFEVAREKIDFYNPSFQSLAGNKAKWFPYNKGGDFRKWYGNNDYVLNWGNDGAEVKAYGHLVPRSMNFQFRESVTWNKITSGTVAFRYKPVGTMFDVGGLSLFSKEHEDLFFLLALCNSTYTKKLLEIISPTLNCESGHVSSIPVKSDTNRTLITQIVRNNISISKIDWDSFETSWDFNRHPFIPQNGETRIADCYQKWWEESENRFRTLKANEEELNRIFIDIYGLQDELTPEVKDEDVTVRRADLTRDVKSFISYSVGCMFGRYSLDSEGLAFAGGTWDASKYRTFIPDADNVLPICDDDYFEDDIISRFVEFVRTVYGPETLEENLEFIARQLGGSGSSRDKIRQYFLSGFFADHCSVYQKRPIYWLFSSGKKNGFKALIYMHRYQPDTIARIRTDYVHQLQAKNKTAIEETEGRLDGARGSEATTLKRKLLKLKDQSEELRVYEEKIHHMADQMIRIDLDDGFKHNYPIFGDVVEKVK